MPKHEEFNEQQELNLFFNTNTTIPAADSPENKRLVAEAPYHPGYEGAVIGTNTFDSIKPISLDEVVKIDNWNNKLWVTTNTDPKPQSVAIDWSNWTVSNGGVKNCQHATITAEPTKSGSAMKFDDGKLPVSLLSTEALLQTAAVLKFGADKYHAHNWRDGFAWSRPLAAAMRHILAYNDGEDRDPESGLSHLAHAACCIMFLLEFEKTHPELDDRYKVDVHKTKEPPKQNT